MNDSDDYNFSVAENSNLASLFGKDGSTEVGNSSLLYKAPKQPSNAEEYKDTKSISTKFYYKYIILHSVIADKEESFGQYILGLMKSESNNPEILIYQNKKNILVRESINICSIANSRKKFSLVLMAGGRSWLLEFMTESDYTEFVSEFSKYGVKITNMFYNYQSNQYSSKQEEISNIQITSKNSDSNLNKIQSNDSLSDMCSNNKNKDAEKDKEEILTRLAKIGLPLLPSLPKEIETNLLDNSCVEEDRKIILSDENIDKSISREREYKLDHNQHRVDIQTIATLNNKSNTYNSFENCIERATNPIQMMSNSISTDPISLIVAENRISNNELRQYMSLLNCKLDSLKNSEEPDANKVVSKLKSKIRALEMKSENLEDELGRCQCKYNTLEKINNELILQIENTKKIEGNSFINKNTSSSQTDPLEKTIEFENVYYKYQLIQLLKSLSCLPLKSDEFDITQLKSVNDNIMDEELQTHFSACMQLLRGEFSYKSNKLDNIEEIKNNYIKTTRQIMSHMYSNIGSSFREHSDMKQLLAEEVRNATVELAKNFEKLVQCKQ